jgi:hypothetical protein
MIEVIKKTYAISNEEISSYCDELGVEVVLENINGEITREEGCGYEVDIDPSSVSISIINDDGVDITEKVSDLSALKEELVENLVIDYDNLVFDTDICFILKSYL